VNKAITMLNWVYIQYQVFNIPILILRQIYEIQFLWLTLMEFLRHLRSTTHLVLNPLYSRLWQLVVRTKKPARSMARR